MEQRPSWETNQFSASQEIPRILWNPKVYYRIHKCPPPHPILSQLDPVHTPTSHTLKIYFNIILPSMLGPPTWSLSFGFLNQNPVYVSPKPHSRYMPRPSHYTQFYQTKNFVWAVQIIITIIITPLIKQFVILPCQLVPLMSFRCNSRIS